MAAWMRRLLAAQTRHQNSRNTAPLATTDHHQRPQPQNTQPTILNTFSSSDFEHQLTSHYQPATSTIMSDKPRQLVHELQPTGIVIHRDGDLSSANSLQVSFQRTIRVSDNNNTTNMLPPSLGSFPLFESSAHKSLPSAMRAKGGYFFPMHRKWFLCYLQDFN
jgi:hypothetical protein